MRTVQIRDVLDEVRKFHGELAEYYRGLSGKADQRRVALLLDYMSSHEKNLEASLAAYERDALREVLDTWIECSHCDEVIASCRKTPIAPDMSVEGVTKLAMDVDACLTRFYRTLANSTRSERLREVFTTLIEIEEAELRSLAMNALGASDV